MSLIKLFYTVLILFYSLSYSYAQEQVIFQNINEYGKVIGISSKTGFPALNTLYYVGASVWVVESLGDYKLIKNVDKGRYMASSGMKLSFANSTYDQSARWVIENADEGMVRIKNEKLGKYLSVNNGQIFFTSLSGKEFETLWQPLKNIDEITQDLERKRMRYKSGGEIRIRSRMSTAFIVTDQGNYKLAEGLSYELESSIWTKIQSGENYYLKSKKNNLYLALNNAGVRLDESKSENALWKLEDYQGFLRLKHVKLGTYLLLSKETGGLLAGPAPTGSYQDTMYADWILFQ